MNLTQERLKEVLHYDPDTGVFTWRVRLSNVTPVGSVAGTFIGSVADRARGRMYRSIKIDRVAYRAHRLAFLYMTGEFPADEVDHTGHDRCDNRWRALTKATRRSNGQNQSLRETSKTGHIGISLKKNGQYYVCIAHKNCGVYDRLEDAVAASRKKYQELGYHPNHGK
jgi:hypothetical protein